MKKSDINPLPPYFDRYINLVDDIELSQAFADGSRQLELLDKSLLTNLDGKRYAPDKWTVKQIFQHIIDWERILSYRALLSARKNILPSQEVDENLLAANTNADRRTIVELIEELKTARASSKMMFESFDIEMLLRTGINWKYEISVLAMGFTIAGHQLHHLKIIEEKYFPLLETN